MTRVRPTAKPNWCPQVKPDEPWTARCVRDAAAGTRRTLTASTRYIRSATAAGSWPIQRAVRRASLRSASAAARCTQNRMSSSRWPRSRRGIDGDLPTNLSGLFPAPSSFYRSNPALYHRDDRAVPAARAQQCERRGDGLVHIPDVLERHVRCLAAPGKADDVRSRASA